MGASLNMRMHRQCLPRDASGGFTIIELLMVLAILLLGVGLFVINIDNAIEGVNRQSPSEVWLQSVRQARLLAVTDQRPVFVSFNADLARFELRTEASEFAPSVAAFALDESDRASIEAVRFWPIEPWLEQENPRGDLEFVPVERSIPFVRFEATGVSNFVAVEWDYAPGVSDPVWMLMDPFSSAVVEGEVR